MYKKLQKWTDIIFNPHKDKPKLIGGKLDGFRITDKKQLAEIATKDSITVEWLLMTYIYDKQPDGNFKIREL